MVKIVVIYILADPYQTPPYIYKQQNAFFLLKVANIYKKEAQPRLTSMVKTMAELNIAS
jgi:hypothetical protein